MYDIIGSREKAVAIIDEGGRKKAEEIMKKHKNVKSVLKKYSGRTGEFRLYRLRLLLGDKNTEVFHKEFGIVFKLDPRKVYFSPREGTERQRIAEKVREGEKILVMFAGVCPYAIAIAKKCKTCFIDCVELNPNAKKYAEENIKINKVSGRVRYIEGDVKKVWRNLDKYDRIIMPLPESAINFLKYSFRLSKKGTIIHLYAVSKENKLFEDVEEKVKKISEKENVKIKIIERQKVLPFAPREWKMRLDIKVEKI